jgi:hypothetical protein
VFVLSLCLAVTLDQLCCGYTALQDRSMQSGRVSVYIGVMFRKITEDGWGLVCRLCE